MQDNSNAASRPTSRQKLLMGGIVVVAIVALIVVAFQQFNKMDGRRTTVIPGAQVSPATPQMLQPMSNPVAERGRVLALAGNCFSCHTADAGKPFAGGVPFYTDFGTIYSTNISSDRQTGIGSWTEAEFTRAMRQGVRKDGQHLYPAFPYTNFTQLTDDDVRALYVFIRTLTPVKSAPPENQMKFPLNIRASLAGWKLLFFKEERFQPSAAMTSEQKRGEYLVSALAHCSACHTPRNALGGEATDELYAGGMFYDHVRTGDVRAWGTPNLTQHASGLKGWSATDIYDYLKTGESSKAVVFGPMNDVVWNSTRHLPERDLTAIAAYIKAIPARSVGNAPEDDKDRLRRGELLYVANCGSCHTLSGAGDPKTAPPLRASAQVQAPNPASLINVILHGPDVSPELHTKVARPDMPAFEAKLSDQEIADLATYMRASLGNAAGPVSAGQVEKQR